MSFCRLGHYICREEDLTVYDVLQSGLALVNSARPTETPIGSPIHTLHAEVKRHMAALTTDPDKNAFALHTLVTLELYVLFAHEIQKFTDVDPALRPVDEDFPEEMTPPTHLIKPAKVVFGQLSAIRVTPESQQYVDLVKILRTQFLGCVNVLAAVLNNS